MEFDEIKLAPTYRLLWGVPGRSNALNIAAGLGLEPGIIGAARQALGQGQVSSQQVCLESSDLLHTHLALAGKRFKYY